MLLDHPGLAGTDLTSLQCLWYGAAPMSASRLEEALTRIGPVIGQLFGQSEAPMMISTLAPAEHFRDDGSLATERLSSAGRPTPLTTVAIMDDEGHLLGRGERGEIVVRGSLVMAGYYKNPQASAEAARYGWHHTGDIGYLDDDNYLFIVDRAKDMIITGGFNVYSAEVEQVLLAHPAVQDCAVIGLPDEKWGERVTAVLQLRPGQAVTADDVRAFVKERLGSVKAPKQVEVWPDLPRSKVGKVLKPEIKAQLHCQRNSLAQLRVYTCHQASKSPVYLRRSGARAPHLSGGPRAVPAPADGLIAPAAQLPAVLLRAARLRGRDLDADRGPVVCRAGPHPQRNPARPDHRGQVPAHVPVRPVGRGVRGPDGQAAGALPDPDAVRAARGGLRRPGRYRLHPAVGRLPAGPRARLRQRV